MVRMNIHLQVSAVIDFNVKRHRRQHARTESSDPEKKSARISPVIRFSAWITNQ